ncbi:hypothetical protein TCAL_08872 [Tigriopus californicus]|uniref:Major facilitator superfamily (MFS) profile domain-containing protein n=1 Tax=Tigriopus californicus TaxID=6832 RepID=A0A553N938_TIGCA|nr:organic cation transporter protein-like [Tigriopus californicus]TRY61932.1 hypothetical protein TCAL_08872 [Tigriopus californicus]|eukprot:TCALIF_08872-PA protein Name:"Similar to Orct Organic cation transporter protein (Drosophila melanogaster)" AED:0.04 eAED:0.04 QI:124/0.5/0.33/1/1/1/3/0/593
MANPLDKKDLPEVHSPHPNGVYPAFKHLKEDTNGATIQAQDRVDPLTEVIGEYGPWQLKWHFLLGVTTIFHGWQMMSNKFLTYKSDYWCAPPETMLNGSLIYPKEQWINISTPLDFDGRLDFCHVFDVDYDSFHQDRPEESSPIRPCHHWHYDHSLFQDTIIQRWDLVCQRQHLPRMIQMGFFAGNFVGVSLSGPVADYFGRKIAYMSFVTMWILASVSSYFTTNLYAWAACRFVIGGCSLAYVNVASVLAVELTNGKWRSITGHIFGELMWNLGIISLGGLVYVCRDMHTLELIMGSCLIPALLLWYFLPESPRWLLSQGKFDEAKLVMGSACIANRKPIRPIEEILAVNQRNYEEAVMASGDKSKQSSFLDLFRYPGIRRNTILVGFAWLSFSMGYFGLFYNTPTFGMNVFLVFIFPALVMIPASIIQPCIENKIGRKTSLTVSLLTAGVMLLVTAALPQDSTAIVICAWIGTIACSFSFGVGYTVTRELFPTVLRTTAMSFSSAMARVGSFVSPFIAMLDDHGSEVPLLVYGGIVFVAGCLSLWIWPETRKIRLPESLEDCERVASSPNSWFKLCLSQPKDPLSHSTELK